MVRKIAQKSVRAFLTVRSSVGMLSILETATLIKKSRIFTCADGGLLRVSWSVGVSSVCLFLRAICLTGTKNE